MITKVSKQKMVKAFVDHGKAYVTPNWVGNGEFMVHRRCIKPNSNPLSLQPEDQTEADIDENEPEDVVGEVPTEFGKRRPRGGHHGPGLEGRARPEEADRQDNDQGTEPDGPVVFFA